MAKKKKEEAPKRPPISTLGAITALSSREVDCGDWSFQIVPVTARDIMYHSARFMIALGADSLIGSDDKAQIMDKMKRMSADAKAKAAAASIEQNEAIACTGVVAVKAKGGDWVPAQLVMLHSEKDHAASPMRIHLPVVCSAESVRRLADAIKALGSDDGRAVPSLYRGLRNASRRGGRRNNFRGDHRGAALWNGRAGHSWSLGGSTIIVGGTDLDGRKGLSERWRR